MSTERIDVLAVMDRLLCRIGIHRWRWVYWRGHDVNVCSRCDKTNPDQSA